MKSKKGKSVIYTRCKQFKYVYRKTDIETIRIRQMVKKTMVYASKKHDHHISFTKALKTKKDHLLGKKIRRGNKISIVGAFIFDVVMIEIMKDMIENKNTFSLPWPGVDLIIATTFANIKKTKGIKSVFTFDTEKSRDFRIKNAELDGFNWNIVTNREITDMLEDETHVNKQTYILCKKLTGKQYSELFRGKFLISSTLRHKRKG